MGSTFAGVAADGPLIVMGVMASKSATAPVSEVDPAAACLVSPVSIRGASTGTNALLVSAFDFSDGTGIPETSDSCLARTRCKSSFRAKP